MKCTIDVRVNTIVPSRFLVLLIHFTFMCKECNIIYLYLSTHQFISLAKLGLQPPIQQPPVGSSIHASVGLGPPIQQPSVGSSVDASVGLGLPSGNYDVKDSIGIAFS